MNNLAQLIGALGALLVVPWMLVMFSLSVALPFLVFRFFKHVRLTTEALARIAAALERQPVTHVDEFRELELARRARTAGQPALR